jgi:putative copper resistance protein D
MQDIQGIANFIDDLLGGLQLISFSIVIGSILWVWVVLRIWLEPVPRTIVLHSIQLFRVSAYTLAITQLTKLFIKAFILSSALGELPLIAYFGTIQFKAGLIRMVFALVLGIISKQLVKSPDDRLKWITLILLTIPLVISGAWLVHGAGRFENRELLMFMTVLHQLGAAVWLGGVAQLLWLWRACTLSSIAEQLWPVVIKRFAWLGISSVVLLVVTGILLAWTYVHSWDGLIGTAYGSLVITKILLLLIALGFAYLNFKAGRRWQQDSHSPDVITKVPYYIEAESFILVSIIFVAATLSSQPPAADIPDLTASVSEVAAMFAPQFPHLTSPTHGELLAVEPGNSAIIGNVPSAAVVDWSDFNHNVSGVFLTVMGLIAMLSYLGGFQWAKYWPIGFVGLGLFIFFRADAETWPLGPIGFWESTFGKGEVLQHRIATLLAFVLGIMETRVRVNEQAHPRMSYLFPVLCACGGILLLTHTHAEFGLIKKEYLIQVSHIAMGLLAITMACSRWLELRLATSIGKVAGFVAIVSLILIGNLLMFYHEPIS